MRSGIDRAGASNTAHSGTDPADTSIAVRLEADAVELHGPITPETIAALAQKGSLRQLYLRDGKRLDRRCGQALAVLPGVEYLQLWCPATRAAVVAALETPGLQTLQLFALHGPGTLRGFATGRTLQQLLVACAGLRTADLLAIAQSPTLREFAASDVAVTPQAMAALGAMPQLELLSLEACGIVDSTVAALPADGALRRLMLAANPLTDAGLRSIVRLSALRGLDLWQTQITLSGLAALADLPELESLSLGHAEPNDTFPPDALFALLAPLPRLSQLELDGIMLSPQQQALFAQRFSLSVVER